ncbi:SMP-30/Gluconolaconase/LRE domain-containing protein [Sphingomonas sp. LH128]|uniref:SMP-30/gluconolactonase/LRE family protein n=1 Tax=Sphingomonas sp. LH128 TaxID=473781 RepID=UPI00027CC53F|nr:SMP-30/gluconolactonase/LRE family protein [Sphingomonas sp. LH128]EJU11912.1 SMP-30/Gluconolaconase/LRE domain-containing protein [Sphingomonas sp. LH128]
MSLPPYEVVADGYDFIEAPRVSADGTVWFADLTATGVYRKRPGHAAELMLPGRLWVGGIVFDDGGDVLCSGRGGIVALNPATGTTRDVLTRIEGAPLVAVNDMEGDGRGGLFAGTIDFEAIFETGKPPSPGLFFHLSGDGEVTVLRRDVVASNGIAASPCGTWLYHMETTRGIWRYPLLPSGLPGPGALLVELEDGDGLTLDAAGNLWAACWSTGRLLRFTPEGTLTAEMRLPYPHVVSVAFGSTEPDWLYVSTGGNADAPRSGAVLRIKVEGPGLPGPTTRLRMLCREP